MASDYEISMLRHELNEAVTRAAQAEMDSWDDAALHKTLGEKYLMAMRAMEAIGTVPKRDIARRTKQMIEDRIYELRERARGVPRHQVRIPHARLYEVGKEHGYTGDYGKTRAEIRAEGGDGIITSPVLPKRAGPRRPDYSERNRRYIDAFHSLAARMKLLEDSYPAVSVPDCLSFYHLPIHQTS